MINRAQLSEQVIKALLGVELKSEAAGGPAKHDPLKIDADPTRAPAVPVVPSAHNHALQSAQVQLTEGLHLSAVLLARFCFYFYSPKQRNKLPKFFRTQPSKDDRPTDNRLNPKRWRILQVKFRYQKRTWIPGRRKKMASPPRRKCPSVCLQTCLC